jgi:hypothetical protein
MAVALDRTVRKILEKAITGKNGARDIAERGARNALIEIGIEDAKRPEGLSQAQIELRNRLRAHARSLGDVMQSGGSIVASRLVREIAYEHWHRALFARFLTENNLLLDPEYKVPVSLTDLEQVAKEEGRDPVELAAEWAEPMLPQIFRKDDPVLALALPPETKAAISELVKNLPRTVFEADDSLGWAYQFWQADRKEEINRSGVKIGADELPAVTQLFTEDYMVLFLLENTLGAWWAGKVLAADPALAAGAQSEEELREKTSPPGYRWTYLRFVREPREGETHETATGPWGPAAGAFEGWPKAAKDLTVLDPCMGSGHFLVFALPILVAFRRVEEGLDERAAVKAVLAENLYGLEIDQRCTQIAAFALALASWKRLGGPEPLPKLNLACSGLAIGLGEAEFLKLAEKIADAEGWAGKADLLGTDRTPFGARATATHRGELEVLCELFRQGPCLGSLIDTRQALERAFGPLYGTGVDKLGALVERLLQTNDIPVDLHESAVTAHGLAKAAHLLGKSYTLIVTNVPYLGRGNQDTTLKNYCERFHPNAKNDLSTCFIERCLHFCARGGSISLVTSQNWFSQPRYKKLRNHLLSNYRWNVVARLGAGAFETISGEVVTVSLVLLTNAHPTRNSLFTALDLSEEPKAWSKASALPERSLSEVLQLSQLSNPDAVITLDSAGGKAPQKTLPFTGRDTVARWENASGDLHLRSKAHNFPPPATLGRTGIAIQRMVSLNATIFSGDVFDDSVAPLIPENPELLPAIYTFCLSEEFTEAVRRINHQPKVIPGALTKVPFDAARWQAIAADKYPRGLPKPFSNDPTQWLFGGHPRDSELPLQVAVARLLGYRWPRQTGSSFMDCPAVSEPDEVDKSGLVAVDGIVPLAALVGQADAPTRLRELIRAVWGPDYNENTIRGLLAAEGAEANDLAAWLADEFFDGHCKLFHQTPFIWHVWDGARGGFSALVNYHRLCEPDGAGRRLLEKLRDSYLGEWIAEQRRAHAASKPGAEDKLIAAEHLRGELTKIIEGEPPYDIFVRWKPLHRQPIGWEPDIDDGVRLNIRPFLIAKPRNPGRKDACILRVTPRVKKYAGADRGAEPFREKEEFPWFWAEDGDVAKIDFAGRPEFKGRRYNDFHYTRAFKERARAEKARTTVAAPDRAFPTAAIP